MSANNCLEIIRGKGEYLLVNKDIETQYVYKVYRFKRLEKAIEKANNIMWDVEYGIQRIEI